MHSAVSRAFAFLLLVHAGAALHGCATSSPTGEGNDPIELRFRWARPAEALVEWTAGEPGAETTTRFRLRTSPVEGSTDFFVRYDGVESDDASSPQALSMRAAAAVELRVHDDGTLADVLGIDRMIDVILAGTLPMLSAGEDAATTEVRERMTTLMLSPGTREMLRAQVADGWKVWSSTWNGRALVPDRAYSETVQHTLFGLSLPARVEHRLVREDNRFVTVHAVTSLDGAAVDAIASHLLKQLFEEPRAASAAQSIETHGQVRVRAASTFDPTTLMPRRVTTETLMQLEVGGEAIEKADRQEWRFTWL